MMQPRRPIIPHFGNLAENLILRAPLSKNCFHYIACNIGQAEIAAGMPEGQLLVVKSETMQNGRVEVMHMHWILGHSPPNFICLAVNHAAFYTTTRQPTRKC